MERRHTLRSIAAATDRDKRTVQSWFRKASDACQDEVGALIDGVRYFDDDERAQLLAYMGEKPGPVAAAPVIPTVTVEIGNHQVVLAQPELPQTYSLESLRQSEVIAFDDPLAIAVQFLQTADALTKEMQRDIRVREQKLQQTQQAKNAIAEKATEFKLEARKYGIVFLLMSQAESAESMGLEGFVALKDAFKAIRLVKACKRHMQTSSDPLLRAYIMADKGWTCMVDDELAHHLTHYHHPRFGKDMPPIQIPTLRSLPLMIAVAVAVDNGTDDGSYEVIQHTSVYAHIPPHPDRTLTAPDTAPSNDRTDHRTWLEKCLGSDFNPTAPDTAPFSDASPDETIGDEETECGDANDEIDGLSDEYLRALLFQCLSEGITNEADQIKQIWGIAKSGENPRYEKARKRLRAVRKKFNF
ncbi:hypothetical protein [Stenomitos frigidus]|uniref:Uncharacterized protein n=1 Tax=Stenomitos frigidus ULC18 TaxID=2107698 RepID=A0A2T1E7L4_9CYAN|nr:hypothetical protein [Stenomitos frigidus]PSB28713.1 hypothetical protein C7B82_12735 [Stenomitos frigidus ULC18]